MTTGRVVVVGLGPGGADLLVPAARHALDRAPRRFVRTSRHQAVADLVSDGIEFESFDDRYDAADDLESVYSGIVDALIAAAGDDEEVAYAVPGNPAVAERTVELLHDAARAGRIEITVVPGLSFADAAWSRLGVDPMAVAARVVDGRDFDAQMLRFGTFGDGEGLLIAQCDTTLVLSDVKLHLLERLAPDSPIIVLQRLGLPDEQVVELVLADLDRTVEPDHLTAVWVPPMTASSALVSATQEIARLLDLAVRLRGPGGCPWDAEQTHHSLTRYLLEESYEVVEAVERLPANAPIGTSPDDPAYAALVDELGDLLYQVIFHALLADEAGAFGLGEVALGIHDKLVRRHPHVFGNVNASTSADVMTNWEQIKKEEKGVESIVAGITPGLPSLLYAHKLLRKGASVGLEPGDVAVSLERIDAATAALRGADAESGSIDQEAVLGDLLAASVALARAMGVDTESALRGWSARFKDRFEAMERIAADRGLELHTMEPGDVEALWAEVDG